MNTPPTLDEIRAFRERVRHDAWVDINYPKALMYLDVLLDRESLTQKESAGGVEARGNACCAEKVAGVDVRGVATTYGCEMSLGHAGPHRAFVGEPEYQARFTPASPSPTIRELGAIPTSEPETNNG